jgi:hypothetical protein
MGEWLLSRRDRLIVAWHEVPVGLAVPDQTVPYGTVLSRDAFPGTSCLATLMLSLRDKIHSTAEALLNSALMGKEGRSSFAASCALPA